MTVRDSKQGTRYTGISGVAASCRAMRKKSMQGTFNDEKEMIGDGNKRRFHVSFTRLAMSWWSLRAGKLNSCPERKSVKFAVEDR